MNTLEQHFAAEAENFDEMAANSRKIAFVRLCLGDERGAAYWQGRAQGLELAAVNLRLPPLPVNPVPSPPKGAS